MSDQPSTPPPPRAGDARGHHGRLIRTLDQAARDAWAAGEIGKGRSYREVAGDLGIAVSSCHEAVRRAYRDLAEPLAGPARAAELATLYAARDAALEVLGRRHITVSNGRVVTLADEEGKDQPIPDDGPILQAAQTVARISATIHDLMGWKAPARVQLQGEVTYQIVGVDPGQLS